MRGMVTSNYITGLTLPVRLSPSADICQSGLREFHRHFKRVPRFISSNTIFV